MADTTLPPGNAKFSGLTDDQASKLFEKIATTSWLMAEMCRSKADEHGASDVALTFHALNTMLLGVGAMADMPSGGSMVGDFADWMVSPLFRPEVHHANPGQ